LIYSCGSTLHYPNYFSGWPFIESQIVPFHLLAAASADKKNKSTPMGDHNHFDGIRLAAAQRQEISRMRPPYWLMRQKIEPMGITLPMSQGR
jgi:hypothetical protein